MAKLIVPATTVVTNTPAPERIEEVDHWKKEPVVCLTEQSTESQTHVTAFGRSDRSNGREDVGGTVAKGQERHTLNAPIDDRDNRRKRSLTAMFCDSFIT